MTNQTITDTAKKLGFDLIGFAPAEELTNESIQLEKWLERGYNAGMEYMSRNAEKRKNVKEILPSAKSVISLGLNYYTPQQYSGDKSKGKISRYAWGEDYHLIIWKKLDSLVEELKKIDPQFEAMTYVDTGPLMDKAWAVKSGIGWLGKHTNIINKEIGSWFFIATVITNYKFDYLLQVEDFCGSCTACLDACPTGAIVEEYVVDANKCISYLTIENKEDIPEEFKDKFDNWIFGCDICQDVCPWNNKFSQSTLQHEFYPKNNNSEIDLAEALNMAQEEFSIKFRRSPVKRTKLKGLKRNAEFLSDQH